MGRYGTVWDGMGRYGTVWDGMGRYGTVWGGLVFSGDYWEMGSTCTMLLETETGRSSETTANQSPASGGRAAS